MPSFSLKTMFVLVLIASLASYALAYRSVAVAIGLMVCVAISLVGITCYSVWTRRPLWLLPVVLSAGYLVLADGGVYRGAERYLPTEWALERCCKSHTVLSSGLKRSKSLTQWTLRLCFSRSHQDWNCVSWWSRPQIEKAAKPSASFEESSSLEAEALTDSTLDDLLELVDLEMASVPSNTVGGVTVALPTIAITSVSTVIVIYKRDDPQNRAFFISGHCLAVLLVLAMVVLWKVQRSKCSFNGEPEGDRVSETPTPAG